MQMAVAAEARGSFFMWRKDYADAETDINRIIGVSPWLKYDRGWNRIYRGRATLALSDFNALIPALSVLRSKSRQRSHDFVSGLPPAQRSSIIAKLDQAYREAAAKVYQGRARALYDLGRYDDSLANYDRAISFWPNNASLFDGRARAHFAQGRLVAGIREIFSYIALNLSTIRKHHTMPCSVAAA
jgi:tetratricopeptide (TPR) repeat protein